MKCELINDEKISPEIGMSKCLGLRAAERELKG